MQAEPVSFDPSSKTSRPWLTCGEELCLDRAEQPSDLHSWFVVIWLTGVDYFSNIAYQAGIALASAGDLAPIATSVLVFLAISVGIPFVLLHAIVVVRCLLEVVRSVYCRIDAPPCIPTARVGTFS